MPSWPARSRDSVDASTRSIAHYRAPVTIAGPLARRMWTKPMSYFDTSSSWSVICTTESDTDTHRALPATPHPPFVSSLQITT